MIASAILSQHRALLLASVSHGALTVASSLVMLGQWNNQTTDRRHGHGKISHKDTHNVGMR